MHNKNNTIKIKKFIHNNLGGLFVLCAVGIVFFTFYQDSFNLKEPIGYDGDSLAVLASIKAVGEGGIKAFQPIRISRLNAPTEAWWSDIPISEFCFLPAGILLKFTDLFTASSIFVGLSFCLAGLAFYISCIWLGFAIVPSVAMSILYGLAPYAFARNLEHIILTLYFVVPLFLLCAYRLWGKEGAERNFKEVLALAGITFCCSFLNPYYLAMFLVLLVLVFLGHLWNKDGRGTLFCGIVLLAAVLGFIAQNIDTFYFRLIEGANPAAVSRDLWWMVKFGLYLPDLFLPPYHDWRFFEVLAGKNYQWKIPLDLRGESQTAYIGLVAACFLIALVFIGFVKASSGSGRGQSVLFWFALVVFLFAVTGGLNYLLGAFGFQMLRASNRYSIFLSAIALFYGCQVMSRFSNRKILLVFSSALLLVFGIIDQTPAYPDWLKSKHRSAMEDFQLDAEFFPRLEKKLGSGAQVFQFPVHLFPESGPVHKMGDYEHFRPYIHTDSLKFSYGTVKCREHADWQRGLTEESPEKIHQELSARNFSAVLINRRAYHDEGENLINKLKNKEFAEVDRNRDFVVLKIL
jgi:phosphoglycerol transferase